MSKYWDIGKILPYQRNFNFINGERSIGKTYTTQKFLINKALKDGKEFVYIVRTQDEKKGGIFEKAFNKVLLREFPYNTFEFTKDELYHVIEPDTEEQEKIPIGYCIALSEAVKVKKLSLPNVYYFMMDEYMLEGQHSSNYVNGWKEPDLLLNIYHTLDREEDRIICFMLGNNTSFYNPYHMHNAFRIPQIGKGEIWTSKYVLFQWAEGSKELNDEKEKCKFLQMIEQTDYAQYAKKGNYVDDNYNLVKDLTPAAQYIYTIRYKKEDYGIWYDRKNISIYVSEKSKPSNLVFVFLMDDHNEDTILVKEKNQSLIKWLGKGLKKGSVFFDGMEVKAKFEEIWNFIL